MKLMYTFPAISSGLSPSARRERIETRFAGFNALLAVSPSARRERIETKRSARRKKAPGSPSARRERIETGIRCVISTPLLYVSLRPEGED